MIIIESNINNITKFMQDLPNRMKRVTKLSIKDNLDYGKKAAVSMAPAKTGMLKSMIVSTLVNNDRGRLMSSVNSPYPYNLWVNREDGYELLPVTEIKAPYFLPGQKPFRYGDPSVLTAGRRTVGWSGVPGFFDKTFNLMEMTFPQQLANNLDLVLNRGI